MHKYLATIIIAALAASSTHAEDSRAYLGLALSKPGHIDAHSRSGTQVESDHSGFSGRLYGGYRLNPNFAIEAGYASYGTFTLPNVGSGAAGDGRIKPASLYAGIKAIYPVSERVDLFGKLNVVHTRVDVSGFDSGDVSINRLMPGIGAEFRVTPKVGLSLEVNRYGNVTIPRTGRLNLNRIEAGVNLRF